MEYVESEKVSIEFYQSAVHSLYKSEEAGHPVFVEMPHIKIIIPGSNNDIIDTRVDDTHKARFPVQWRNFLAGMNTDNIAGWKLDTWPAVNTAQVKTLQYMGVHTVEQLADMSDQSCQKVGMGTMELRIKAKAALKAASSGAAAEAAASENQRLQDELADLKAQFAMFARQKTEEETTRAKPGPKPKERATEAA